jgi:CubicO group peptidase (beta-lactamase class C family)
MRLSLLSLVAGAALSAFALDPVAAMPELKTVNETVEPYAGRDAPGIAVLVMKNGEILHMKGYGVSDIDKGTEVDERTIFDLASVSKQMTAFAAMLQIQEGLYDGDTAVSTILGDRFSRPDDPRPLTINDLIHHLSGLTDYLAGDDQLGYSSETTNDQVLAWLASQPLDQPPGTKWDYSNSGYLTLGSVVAAADSAESLRDVLRTRIWEPLGMGDSGLVTVANGVAPDRVATGYKGENGQFEPSAWDTAVEGDGSVKTDLVDLAKYEAALATNTLLDQDATALLFQNGNVDDGTPIEGGGYGFGWNLETSGGEKYALHGGSWMGSSAQYQRNLTTGVTVIVLSNGEDLSAAALASEIEQSLD